MPLKAASSLAAWSLGNNGVLKLRTSPGTDLKAFYQSAEAGKGDRIWIDFPGELVRTRSLKGSGPIKEIRLGKPQTGLTRFVIEFQPFVSINPSKLQLVGISPDLWELKFVGLPIKGLKSISEGNISKTRTNRSNQRVSHSSSTIINLSDLPDFERGRYRVVIDPGHGGPDVGAVGIRGIRESEIVLDISLQVAQILEKKGVIVHLTRKSERDVDLPPRVVMANRLRANAFVSIHANASRSRSRDVNGIETFFYSGSKGFRLASLIQKEILQVSPGSPDRGVRRGRYFVIRRTNMPAVLVETGFVTGRLDSSRLSTASHRRMLAIAISKGILNYLKEVS